ncbi:MAG: SDR family NAD(P)-dependent oxidoreductase [Deltaproteobacteria bacterium]|nr:SDR family NAD(P)-dependent oxidoreductase [Deltaproteobacteria bacterium]
MKGKVLLIGNSDGIGLALTRQLLERDWSVYGISRSASSIVSPQYSHSVSSVCEPNYRTLLDKILGSEKLDLCVYCAGIGDLFNAKQMERDVVTIETNLIGLAKTAEIVIPRMCATPPGVFVGLSSMADLIRSASAPAYAASKAGMSAYLEGLGGALRNTGVSVVNIRLGFVDTKMAKAPFKPFMMSAEQAAERILRSVLARSPKSRVNIPRRMALIMRFLHILPKKT